MAFNSNSNTNTGNNASTNDGWKAQGFLNLYLPSKDGKKRKLGAIPLKESKPSEKALLVWLNEDPTRVAKILASLQMEYQSAVPNEATGFDLP